MGGKHNAHEAPEFSLPSDAKARIEMLERLLKSRADGDVEEDGGESQV